MQNFTGNNGFVSKYTCALFRDVNIDLHDCTSADIIHDSYCLQLGSTSLSWTDDVVVGPELFCCYALRPSPEHRLAFTDFMCRLTTDQKGFVTEIEPFVDMLILPRGPVSSKLGENYLLNFASCCYLNV